MPERAEQVLRMAGRGWRLFPVREREKRPLIADWPTQATNDQTRLSFWLKTFANCNWAVATGPDSGIFVLDVDGEHGKQSLLDLERQGCAFATSLMSHTGNGAHIYLQWPNNGKVIRNSVSKFAPGLDVRGAGGYIIVPPSVHPSGTAYEFVDEDTPVAAAPQWLLERLVQPTPVTAAGATGATVQPQSRNIPEGQRNASLTSLAGAMRRRGMTQRAIEDALLAENEERCVPPLDEQEVKVIAQSVSRYKPNVMTPRLPQGWQVCDLSHAMAGTGQKPPWVIEDLLLSQSATQVSAHPHSMKSLAWLVACLESVATHKVWGHFDASAVNSSLFIETEDSMWVLEQRIREIAKGLGVSRAEDAPGFHYVRTGPFDLASMEKELTQILDRYKPDFAVLSTLQNLLGGRDWTRQNDMQAINALIVRLSDQYCPIVEITHSPWDGRNKRAIGTVSQAANFLTAIHFEKKISGADTFVHVTLDSKLGAEESDFTLKLETDGESEDREVRRFVYQGTGWPKGLGREAVIAAINEDPTASPKEIAERTGVTARYVQKIKKSMAEQDE